MLHYLEQPRTCSMLLMAIQEVDVLAVLLFTIYFNVSGSRWEV